MNIRQIEIRFPVSHDRKCDRWTQSDSWGNSKFRDSREKNSLRWLMTVSLAKTLSSSSDLIGHTANQEFTGENKN